MPGEDLALPVKREVIAVLGDQDMGEKTGTGEALGDRALRGGRLMNSSAGPAAIARPADADNPKPRGHMIEHLADGLADHMQFAAAARGVRLMFEIEPLSLRDRCAGRLCRSVHDPVSWPLLMEAWLRPAQYRHGVFKTERGRCCVDTSAD